MGSLEDFPLLYYFRNCGIKNTGLVDLFRPLRGMLTKIPNVCMQTQLETGQFDYDLFLDWWDQIRMCFSLPQIYTI